MKKSSAGIGRCSYKQKRMRKVLDIIYCPCNVARLGLERARSKCHISIQHNERNVPSGVRFNKSADDNNGNKRSKDKEVKRQEKKVKIAPVNEEPKPNTRVGFDVIFLVLVLIVDEVDVLIFLLTSTPPSSSSSDMSEDCFAQRRGSTMNGSLGMPQQNYRHFLDRANRKIAREKNHVPDPFPEPGMAPPSCPFGSGSRVSSVDFITFIVDEKQNSQLNRDMASVSYLASHLISYQIVTRFSSPNGGVASISLPNFNVSMLPTRNMSFPPRGSQRSKPEFAALFPRYHSRGVGSAQRQH